jgi:hypothetical protein
MILGVELSSKEGSSPRSVPHRDKLFGRPVYRVIILSTAAETQRAHSMNSGSEVGEFRYRWECRHDTS